MDFGKAKWCEIFEEITRTLVDNEIPPGYKQRSSEGKNEHYLKGLNYISYRYEREEPDNDLFSDVEFNIPNQSPNAVLEEEEVSELGPDRNTCCVKCCNHQ